MAVNVGTRYSGSGPNAARLVVDMSKTIHDVDDTRMELFRLASKMKSGTVHNREFKWLTDELVPKSWLLDGAIGAGTDPIVCDAGSGLNAQVGDVLFVPSTDELMLVDGAPASTTIPVTRGYAGTTAAAAADNAQVINLGPAYDEGAGLEAAVTTTEVEKTNYTQIFRHPYTVTNTLLAMGKAGGLYGGEDRKYQRAKKAREHARAINHTMYFGRASSVGNKRTTGGIDEQIPTANKFSTDPLTEAQFNVDLETGMRKGSGTKFMFTGRRIAGLINEWAQAITEVSVGTTKLGHKVMSYNGNNGMVKIVIDDTLETVSGAAANTLGERAYLVDMAEVEHVTLAGRNTMLLVDRQNNDVDGVTDEFLTEGGARWGHPDTHARWDGITASA